MTLNSNIELKRTADGSYTIFVPELDEHYHSVNGAIQEANHVYINAGFMSIDKDDINILEIGFGTGLNAYLTFLEAEKSKKKVNYITLELYPLDVNFISQLNYANDSGNRDIFKKLHTCDWNTDNMISENFNFHKIKTDLKELNLDLNKKMDLIYFDAFAPDKQPEMWSQEIFNFLYLHTNKGGILTTYCAKGMVRRMLQTAGYKVERIPGPPGKREMLRALKE